MSARYEYKQDDFVVADSNVEYDTTTLRSPHTSRKQQSGNGNSRLKGANTSNVSRNNTPSRTGRKKGATLPPTLLSAPDLQRSRKGSSSTRRRKYRPERRLFSMSLTTWPQAMLHDARIFQTAKEKCRHPLFARHRLYQSQGPKLARRSWHRQNQQHVPTSQAREDCVCETPQAIRRARRPCH
jgi:hypothetical protein